jgi:indolepyruvate ferredoxin oxidoreductase beta subunit
VLPFARSQFEDAIRQGGVGVSASLAAFAAGYDAAQAPEVVLPVPVSLAAEEIIAEGARRLVDYQDAAYAESYRARLAPLRGTGKLLEETARYLALWMSFEDPIRVADLKIRASRFRRVEQEVRLAPGQVLRIREFMHPRLQEIAETLPGPFGKILLGSSILRSIVGGLTRKGRVIETTGVVGFLTLWGVASLRRWRRTTLRFAAEHQAIDAWMAKILLLSASNPGLALEVAECQRLVKGYSDTHERGRRNFDTLMALLPRLEAREDGAVVLAGLREAALADDTGAALRGALAQAALA